MSDLGLLGPQAVESEPQAPFVPSSLRPFLELAYGFFVISIHVQLS